MTTPTAAPATAAADTATAATPTTTTTTTTLLHYYTRKRFLNIYMKLLAIACDLHGDPKEFKKMHTAENAFFVFPHGWAKVLALTSLAFNSCRLQKERKVEYKYLRIYKDI